jgi:hypothetical protein
VNEKMTDDGGAPSIKDRLESLKQAAISDRKREHAEYLLKNSPLKDVLCFQTPKAKNAVYMRLALVIKHIKPELLVFRLVELGLFEEVVIESYPTRRCRKECLEKRGRKCVEYTTVCEDVTKDIVGLMPSEELVQVCRSLGALPDF